MTDVTIYDGDTPDGRPATDEEIATLLAGAATANDVLNLLASLNAADGTNYLDIYNATRDED
jgi:hypothetical protein